MKKILTAALLTLASSSLLATPSFAGCCFGLIPHSCGCCSKFCVRQYNAFSPVCCGTVYCDGCCPFGSGGCGGGCGPCGDGMCCGGLNYFGVLGCGPSGCCGGCCPPGGCCADGACPGPMTGGSCGDGSCLGSLPASDPAAPGATAPPASGTTTPPASNPTVSPSPLPSYLQSSPTSQLPNYRTIQNASYRPAAAPAANTVSPVRMRPQMMAAPSYWDN
ncbi:MAG TPA: hypothetical protein VH643_25110 [Gemmataceae bacterium]|jgi:hypothetical protein